MGKLLKKLITKNIVKILKIYKKSLENDELIFKNYLDQTLYREIDFLIKLIKEKKEDLQ